MPAIIFEFCLVSQEPACTDIVDLHVDPMG